MPKGFKSILSNLLTGGLSELGDTVKKFVTTDADREKLEQEMEKIQNRKLLELEKMDFERYSIAHQTFRDDSQLQKIFASTFLVGYMLLTGTLVVFLLQGITPEDMPQWGVSLLSAVWGGMTGKLNTITDFLFGSSSDSKQKNSQQNPFNNEN